MPHYAAGSRVRRLLSLAAWTALDSALWYQWLEVARCPLTLLLPLFRLRCHRSLRLMHMLSQQLRLPQPPLPLLPLQLQLHLARCRAGTDTDTDLQQATICSPLLLRSPRPTPWTSSLRRVSLLPTLLRLLGSPLKQSCCTSRSIVSASQQPLLPRSWLQPTRRRSWRSG